MYYGLLGLASKKPAAYGALTSAWITATGETDTTIISALNTLESNLTTYGLTSKIKALYPFVGETSTKHSYNFINTGTYQISWYGGMTHSSNGIVGNQLNAYGDTGFAPNSFSSQNDIHISIYSRTNLAENTFDMYSEDSAQNQSLGFTLGFASNYYMRINTNTYSNVSNSDTRGFYIGTRTGSTSTKGYKNNSTVITGTTTSTSPNSFNLYICARNFNNTASSFTLKQYSFASIGNGLSDTDASNLYTAVQAFQTTLGRNV
jgi:hypothetical protein